METPDGNPAEAIEIPAKWNCCSITLPEGLGFDHNFQTELVFRTGLSAVMHNPSSLTLSLPAAYVFRELHSNRLVFNADGLRACLAMLKAACPDVIIEFK